MTRWDWTRERWQPDAVTSGHEVTDTEPGVAGLTAPGVMNYSMRGALISSFMQMSGDSGAPPQRIYQLSPHSALSMLPQVQWPDVLAAQGEIPELSADARTTILEDMEVELAAWDTFLVPAQGGWGVDYTTYLADNEINLEAVLRAGNRQMLNNLKNFAAIEEGHKRPLAELMAEGKVTAEFGALLSYPAAAFTTWDWHKIRPIDVPSVILRCRELVAMGHRRGIAKDGHRKDTELWHERM